MGIPNKFDRLGTITDELPAGYLAAEFLEFSGTQYCRTNLTIPNLRAQIKYQIGIRKNCVVASVYRNYSPAGHYGFHQQSNNNGTGAITTLVGVTAYKYDNPIGSIIEAEFDYSKQFCRVNTITKYGTVTPADDKPVLYIGAQNGVASNVTYGTAGVFFTGRIMAFEAWYETGKVADFVPILDEDGIACFYDKVNKQTFTNDGTGQFIVGMTIEQARQLSKLPVTEAGTLTVSLPWEAQWDTGVQNALQVAADKWWTITVQYREPEVATTHLPISFLESTGTQRILLDVTATDDLGGSLDYVDFYANTDAPMLSAVRVNNSTPRFYFPYSSKGTSYIGWDTWDTIGQGSNKNLRTTAILNLFNDRKYKMSFAQDVFEGLLTKPLPAALSDQRLILFCYTNETVYRYVTGRVFSLVLTQSKTVIRRLIPALTPTGIPCMFDTVSDNTFTNDGTGSFIAGFDTAMQSRKLASLPDVTTETDATKKSLTVSLPWEAQWDAGVQAALKVATDRGWTLTVQYREPEIATTNTPISFLESTGSQYIATDFVPNNESGIFLKSYLTTQNDTVPCGSRNSATTNTRFYAVRSPRQYEGSTRFINGYGWGLWRTFAQIDVNYVETTYLNWMNDRFAKCKAGQQSLSLLPFDPEYPLYLFAANIAGGGDLSFQGRIWTVAFSQGSQVVRTFLPVITPTGIPCMWEKLTRTLYYNSGAGAFIAGFDTIEQARKLAALPNVIAEPDITKKSLTVSLPWEAQWDEIVQAALQIAADRGWIITVQYRDPKVATANIPISFLESTGTQYIDTLAPIHEADVIRCVVQANPVENNVANYMFGGNSSPGITFACGPYGTLQANPSSWWAFAWAGTLGGAVMYVDPDLRFKKWDTTLFDNKVKIKIDSLVFERTLTGQPGEITGERTIYLFGVNYATPRYTAGRIYHFEITNDELNYALTLTPVITPAGVPCMFDAANKKTFTNEGTGSFIAGFDTIEQASKLAYLPDVTAETDETKKSLTVSLPWEAQLVITGVPAALQVAADRGWIITIQYRDPEADNAYYTKYANCVSLADLQAVNADYKNDLTGDGTWIYPLDNFTGAGASGENGAFRSAANLKSFNARAPKITNMNYMFAFTGTVEYVNLAIMNIANVTNCRGAFRDTKVSKEVIASFNPNTRDFHQLLYYIPTLFETRDDGKTYFPYFPVINEVVNGQATFMYRNTSKLYLDERYTFDAVESTISMFQNGYGSHWGGLTGTVRLNLQNCTNATRMFSNCTLLGFYSPLPKLTTATGMFNKCLLDKESVLSILDELPTWTDGAAHAITLGIHIDHQNDADIDAAITAAEEKGWTVSVQWNGTATAQSTSTFGLRKPPIYAKLDTAEHPDGIIENILDWGHYVTNWAENGYQEFSSIEEAQTHFNINQTEEV